MGKANEAGTVAEEFSGFKSSEAAKKRYYAKAKKLFRINNVAKWQGAPKPTSYVESVNCKFYTKPKSKGSLRKRLGLVPAQSNPIAERL